MSLKAHGNLIANCNTVYLNYEHDIFHKLPPAILANLYLDCYL